MKKVFLVIGGIISFFLTSFLLLFQIVFMITSTMKYTISKDNINTTIQNINFEELLELDENEEIYKVSGSLGLTKDETRTMMNSKALKSFISNKLYVVIDSVGKNEEIRITIEEAMFLIEEVEKETNIVIKDKDKLVSILNENLSTLQSENNINDSLENQFDPEIIEFVTSIKSNLFILFGVLFIMIYLLISLFRLSFYKSLMWFSVPTLINGLITLMVGGSLKYLIPTLINEEFETFKGLFTPLMDSISKYLIIFSIVFIVTSIVFIVIFVAISKKKASKEDKKIENI